MGRRCAEKVSLKGDFDLLTGSLVQTISPLIEATCDSTPTDSIMTHESFRFVGSMDMLIKKIVKYYFTTQRYTLD